MNAHEVCVWKLQSSLKWKLNYNASKLGGYEIENLTHTNTIWMQRCMFIMCVCDNFNQVKMKAQLKYAQCISKF